MAFFNPSCIDFSRISFSSSELCGNFSAVWKREDRFFLGKKKMSMVVLIHVQYISGHFYFNSTHT